MRAYIHTGGTVIIRATVFSPSGVESVSVLYFFLFADTKRRRLRDFGRLLFFFYFCTCLGYFGFWVMIHMSFIFTMNLSHLLTVHSIHLYFVYIYTRLRQSIYEYDVLYLKNS